MHPLMPVDLNDQTRQETVQKGGWGSVVALVLVLAILAIVAIAISEGGTAVTSETVPGEAPLSPGE